MDESTDLNKYENEENQAIAEKGTYTMGNLKDHLKIMTVSSFIKLKEYEGYLFQIQQNEFQESETMAYNSTKEIRGGTEELFHNSSSFSADSGEEEDFAENFGELAELSEFSAGKTSFSESRLEANSCLTEENGDEDKHFRVPLPYEYVYASDEIESFEEINALLLLPEVLLTNFEQDRISEKKARRWRKHSPYSGRRLGFSEDHEKLDNIWRNTKSFVSCLVEAVFFGRGLSRSMKILLVFALISCAAGENSFCSSSELRATPWFSPNIEVFGRYESCYEWQKWKVGACLPPERKIVKQSLEAVKQSLRAPKEMTSWQRRYAPFTTCVALLNRSFVHMNVQNPSSYIDNEQTMGLQIKFFQQICTHSGGLNDTKSFQQIMCNEHKILQFLELLKVTHNHIYCIWFMKLIDEKQVTEPCDHRNQSRICPSRCSGKKTCSSFYCQSFRLVITVRAHEPTYIKGLWALTVVNRRIPVHIQILCEKVIRRHRFVCKDYVIVNLYRLDTLLSHGYYDIIENYTSLLKSLLSQEYCYNNRYHSITKTEKNKNRHNITLRPEYILKDKLESYNSENCPLRTIIYVLICTSCVLVHVTCVTKVTVWFIHGPQVSNPELWILCSLYSAYTSDLIWLWGPPILFHIETENFEANSKNRKLESENHGVQEIGKLLDPCISIKEDYVPSKTKGKVVDDCSKDEILASSRENEEKVDEFRSLQGENHITKADIERESKYLEHLALVDLVYSTEKETTTYNQAITHDFEKVKEIHELSVPKAFNLSETEIFAFVDSENDIEFDGKKENNGQKITSLKVPTCVTDKRNKYDSGSAKDNPFNFRLHVIPNPSSDISDVKKMYEKPILIDKLDLKSKSKIGKILKKKKLNGVFKEAELAAATREYTWLSLAELPVPKVDITVAFVPQFEPLLSIIDQIANGTPPTPHISMRYELLRFCTLRSYPKENKPYLIMLAEAGFYYASDGDGVVCYCCGVRRYNWVAEDNPMKIHERINPNCKYLRKNEEVNVPVKFFGPFSESLMAIMDIPEPMERSERSEDVNNDWAPERIRSPATAQQNRQIETGANSLGINTAIPKHTQYATKTAREASFNGWPDSASHTPQELADGGFFYAGFGDCVRCFFCGIGLRHWTKEDNPWIEHARWSRNCVFVKQKKGEEFVNLVQLAVQYSQDNDTQTSTGAENQLPAQEIERILLSDAAQSVLEMGYQPRIIKQAIEQSLQQNDSRKITAQILMEKVLEIEELESQTVVAHTEAAASALPVVKPASDTLKETGVNSSKPKTEKNDNKVQNGKTCAEDKTKQTDHAKNKLESTNETLDNDPKAIKAENEQLKEQTLCKVCLDNTVCIVFLPCGHLVTCADCAPAMRKCPICRALVKGTVRTYMS